MGNYRLYFFQKLGGHIERFEPITADCDTEAMKVAMQFKGLSPLELWWRGRKVGEIPVGQDVG